MSSVLSAMAPLLLPLALFLLISARYGAALNLWGDEAYALNVATKPVGEILAADPFHLPTYYLLLHPIVGFFPPGNELPLRLIHALIFSIGLGFCWRIARSLLGRGRALWGVMIFTILLPNYIFYATNIRMFALLFAASMAFLWTAFRLLTPGVPKRRAMAWHLLTALLCALVDWPGLLLVGITWLALLLLRRRWLLARGWCNGRTLAVLGALAAIALLVLREPLWRLIVAWPSSARAAAAGAAGAPGLGALAKTLFFSSRPLLDMVYPPVYPLLLNLLLWLLLVLAVAVAAVVLWRGGDERQRLVVLLAFSWLVAAPFGLAVTRVFLPAQFFLLLSLAIALQRPIQEQRRPLVLLLCSCLIAVGLANLQQAIFPTLRLYSRIPFAAIAKDAIAAAGDRNLATIAVSRHTLNALALERFARPQLAPSQRLRLLDVRPVCGSFPRGTFVYVQLMEEDGEDSDPRRICGEGVAVQVERLRSYVPFAEFGYNRLWDGYLKDRGEAAARLQLVTIPAAVGAPGL
jgi:hypothetical protein